MARIRIPQTGTEIYWPPSADKGRARIAAHLHFTAAESRVSIGVELSFKRDPFRRLFKRSDYLCYLRTLAERESGEGQPLGTQEQDKLDRLRPFLFRDCLEQFPPDHLLREWGKAIAGTLYQDAYAAQLWKVPVQGQQIISRPNRNQRQVLHGEFGGIAYRLRINRDDLLILHPLVLTTDGAERLVFEVRWYLLPTCLIDYALKGLARGKPDAQIQHDLMHVIRCAVYLAKELVEQGRQNPGVRQRIQSCLTEEGYARSQPTLQALALADRTLRPALERYGVEPLTTRRISDMTSSKDYESFADFFNRFPEYSAEWTELLLGSPGAASRYLKYTE